MSSAANDSTEVILREWVKRAKSSQREGSRLMARFIRDAKREQNKVQRQVGHTAHEALVGAAAMLRREVDQLQVGLKAVSGRLATFEQEQKKAPARAPARRVHRTRISKRRSTRKAA